VGAGGALSGSFDAWLRPVFTRYALLPLPAAPLPFPSQVASLVALATTLLAIALGFSAYWLGRPSPQAVPAALPWLYDWAVNRGYLDEIYDSAVVVPLRTIGRIGGQVIEPLVFEGGIDAAAGVVLRLGGAARSLQSGYLRSYALATGLGAAVLLAFLAIHR
jgi:NADH-quinone oxidoreductase subunit L